MVSSVVGGEEEIDLTDRPASGHGHFHFSVWQPAANLGCGGGRTRWRDEGPKILEERIAHSAKRERSPSACHHVTEPNQSPLGPQVTTF